MIEAAAENQKMEPAKESPGWQSYYQVNVGEEEAEMLESIDPHWRATHWLQMAVQGITKEEVPWYKLVTLLMLAVEGATLSLAKCLLVVWRWSMRVCGEDTCPPTPTILHIGQFMTGEENGRGHRRATMVCGLLVHPAVSRQGCTRVEMGLGI